MMVPQHHSTSTSRPLLHIHVSSRPAGLSLLSLLSLLGLLGLGTFHLELKYTDCSAANSEHTKYRSHSSCNSLRNLTTDLFLEGKVSG